MKIQPVVTITYPNGDEEIHNIKLSINNVANFGIKEAGFWFYTLHDDLIIVHPNQLKKIKVSQKQVK